jgi:spore coat-associated protein N
MASSPGTGGATQAPPPAPAQEEETSRWDAIMRNRRRLLIALLLILIAAAIAVLSTAVFTSSDANAGNLFASGTLQVESDDGAILSAERMVPGDTVTGSVGVENTGDVSGTFSVTSENLQNTGGSPPLSNVLTLEIVEQGGTSNPIYEGPLHPVDEELPPSWPGGEQRTYDFTVTMEQEAGNEYQGKSSEVTFRWTAVND